MRLTTSSFAKMWRSAPSAASGPIARQNNSPPTNADDEERTRDRFPQRLRRSLPKHRRWWVPVLSRLIDALEGIHF
eukprot:7562264-Pyramimonas_sp.AAC.1